MSIIQIQFKIVYFQHQTLYIQQFLFRIRRVEKGASRKQNTGPMWELIYMRRKGGGEDARA